MTTNILWTRYTPSRLSIRQPESMLVVQEACRSPTADGRRQSYDEGDEYSFEQGPIPDRFPDEPPDIFYQPASTSYRPLPAVPDHERPPYLQTDLKGQPGQPPYPIGTPSYNDYNQQPQWVPRSTSLISHTATPHVSQPLRSKPTRKNASYDSSSLEPRSTERKSPHR